MNKLLIKNLMHLTIKYIFAFVITGFLIYSCSNRSSPEITPTDLKEQAAKDSDSLKAFFSNFYYDSEIDSIKKIEGEGKIALSDDDNLKDMDVTENDVDYKLYYYITEEGIGTPITTDPKTNEVIRKGNPTKMDSILETIQPWRIIGSDNISFDEDEAITKAGWRSFAILVYNRGLAYGYTKFKGGENITNNGPITYENGGKGILILPSGLAYPLGSQVDLEGINLMYYINLYDFVEDTDHDNDGIPSIKETSGSDVDQRKYDTDEDGFPNYLDGDDDNDGVLTIRETPDNSDPRENDTDGDDIPNYLDNDDDNDGVLTIRETPDNGDPRKNDTDGDKIPNYLDEDDDNDGVLTKNEDANNDGDPTDDFSDSSKPSLPDYLNPNVK